MCYVAEKRGYGDIKHQFNTDAVIHDASLLFYF